MLHFVLVSFMDVSTFKQCVIQIASVDVGRYTLDSLGITS